MSNQMRFLMKNGKKYVILNVKINLKQTSMKVDTDTLKEEEKAQLSCN